jgi:hypothetical protein
LIELLFERLADDPFEEKLPLLLPLPRFMSFERNDEELLPEVKRPDERPDDEVIVPAFLPEAKDLSPLLNPFSLPPLPEVKRPAAERPLLKW